MSFVDGYYTLNFSITNIVREIYETARERTCKHPDETMIQLAARIIAFAHAYENGICFTQGLYEPSAPSLQVTSVTQELELWVEVGTPRKKKLQKSLRGSPSTRHVVYLFSSEQIDETAHHLRGAKTNWIEGVDFYVIETAFVEALVPFLNTRTTLDVSIIEEAMYIGLPEFDRELQGSVSSVDLWEEFQRTHQ